MGQAGQESLNYGILMLLVPPVAIFLGIFYTAYYYMQREREEAEERLPRVTVVPPSH